MEPFNFNLFSITDQGIALDNRDIEWFALETVIILSVLRLHWSIAILNSFVDYDGYSISSKDSCPQ